MRLADATAGRLPAHVQRPGYDRHEQRIGIVHLGLGAFHRAHQAVYTDDAMNAGDGHWAIAGVSLRGEAVRDQLMPQDGLYTVTARGERGDPIRLIGALRRSLVAPEDPAEVVALIASVDTRVVTLTVTEKGYHRRPDGTLDVANELVAADIAGGSGPRTIYGFLLQALAMRRAASVGGVTIVSCDNLSGNGAQLARLLGEFAERRSPGMSEWIRRECTCPATMVDRIVPSAMAGFLDDTEARLGLRDEAAVATEPFRQWVIEDRFAGPRPAWEAGGAEFVADVGAYETRKLRLLNGAHSALAYLGLERGHRFVHEAIRDPSIRPLVERLMREEAAPTLPRESARDAPRYANELLQRFENPALEHRLAQIAMDGSQKIPQRWLATLEAQRLRGQACPAILAALAAWIVHVRGKAGVVIDDPSAAELGALWRHAGAHGIVAALFGSAGRFGAVWTPTDADRKSLTETIARQ